MSIEDMERKMAQRVFQLRADRLKTQLRGLPLAEKFRAIADFVDAGQKQWAQSLGRLAMGDLERLCSGRAQPTTVAETADPSCPDPPRAQRINYRCTRCGCAEASGPLPSPSSGALAVYPLPSGWKLVPCPVLDEDDHLHCAVCVEQQEKTR